MHRRPSSVAPLPVICVGNFTAGGAGKTPVARLIASRLAALGKRPGFLSRGYGGQRRGPHLVDPRKDTAHDVGDEPLLLARDAPTVISRDRSAGARLLAKQPVDVIVMDDGLQNPTLAKDLGIAVIDGTRGLGNGAVIPAGPLRAPLVAQRDHVGLVIWNGTPDGQRLPGEIADLPSLVTTLKPDDTALALAGQRVVGFAGIGDPRRFERTLDDLGCTVARFEPFADHHPYTATDLARLSALATRHDADLVTTEKDMARIAIADDRADDPHRGKVRLHCVPVTSVFRDARDGDQLDHHLQRAIDAFATRRADD